MPGFRDRFSRSDFFNIADDEMVRVQFSHAVERSTTALLGTGEVLAPPQPPALILIGDSVPGDTSTTATLTVDAPHTIGTTETIGDQDFYKVTLTAGQDYEVGMYGYDGGPSGIAQPDSYIEIYDSAGNLVASGDGGAPTLRNNANSGFDVLMTFTAETSGTYYINARAFDQDPTNGTTGDTVGDYELFVQTASPFAYHPYYSSDSPLYAIDWGTQVDGSSRNPDGEEGPRPTDNPETGYAYNPYGIEGKNVITYYFAKQGEVFIDEDPTTPGTTDTIVANGFADWEKAAYLKAMGVYSDVADIVYVEVPTRAQADFVFITYNGTPGPGVSLLGQMNPPDEENEGRSMFNAADERWTEEGLQPGGFSFVTLVHEMGHGHGLAHPHDNGGHSGIMHGVEPEGVAFDYTRGDFDLNQGIYTVMSYEDGWQTSPYGQADTTDPYGWLGSLMAFDIAAIQDKYGVNEDFHTGDDSYVIKDVNAPGTYYSCIWDAGGLDTISYAGAADAKIDLRPATLEYEYGGGGWVSYATGIFGGFTIANGVTIENAVSGSGNDVLTGNDAANMLSAGAGNDTLDGGLGDDRMLGGAGNDYLAAGAGADVAYGDSGDDLIGGQDGNDFIDGGDGVDTLYGDAGNDFVVGGLGGDQMWGQDGIDRLEGREGDDSLNGGIGDDQLFGGDGFDHLVGGDGNDQLGGDASDDVLEAGDGNDLLDGGAGADRAFGGAGADYIVGGIGNDQLYGEDGDDVAGGGDGNDLLEGGAGADHLYGDAGADYIVGGIGGDFIYGQDDDDIVGGQEGDDSIDGGNGADKLYGDDGNDSVLGGAGNDELYGQLGNDSLNGGLGADILNGGAGTDSFAFTTALGGGNVDQIVDFAHGADQILLDHNAFAGLSAGALGSGAFVTGTAAGDGDDRILYDAATGNLYFDADGNGAGAAVLFATLQGAPAITASDFTVI